MDLSNLTQFNKRLFKKLFGLYVQRRRTELKLSIEHVAEVIGYSVAEFKAVESGQKSISQEDFDYIRNYLALDSNELLNIGKITQVENIMNFVRVVDEHYPR